MNIYFLRHGIAQEHRATLPENERVLTAEGRRKMRRIARAMRAMGLQFDCVLSSPLVRAVETAEAVCRELDCRKRLVLSPALRPGAGRSGVLKALGELPVKTRDVLLVGHEPDLGALVSGLISGQGRVAIHFKKGSLCKVRVQNVRQEAAGALEWLLAPGPMLLMARCSRKRD